MWKTFHDAGSYWCNYFPSIPIIFFIQENMIYINFFISYFIILNTLFNILWKVNLKNAIKLLQVLTKRPKGKNTGAGQREKRPYNKYSGLRRFYFS